MVDPALLALRLLELAALLFPVVGLLLQLQHRAADTDALERSGILIGLGLVVIVSLTFSLTGLHLVRNVSAPVLLTMSLGASRF